MQTTYRIRNNGIGVVTTDADLAAWASKNGARVTTVMDE